MLGIELGTFAGVVKPTDIVQLAEDVINEQQLQIKEKKLVFSATFATNIPLIQIDPKLLRMVIQNLFSNAIKYTPDGGKIAVQLIMEDSNSITLRIADTGYGIPKNQYDKIFTKLFRADNVIGKDTEGTGLGLYIAKSIVEQSNGKLWFESEENVGTTFHVTLPLGKTVKKDTLDKSS